MTEFINNEDLQRQQLLLFHDPKIEKLISPERSIHVGRSGELFTRSKLFSWGFTNDDSERHQAHDVTWYDGIDNVLVRIQVKTKEHSSDRMTFNFQKYKEGDFDIAACVSLEDGKVLFSPGVVNSITYRLNDFHNLNELDTFKRSLSFLKDQREVYNGWLF